MADVPDLITQVKKTDKTELKDYSAVSNTSNESNEGSENKQDEAPVLSLWSRIMCCFTQHSLPLEFLSPSTAPSSGLLPPPSLEYKSKICLILDLDETLVHSSFQPVTGADFEIPLSIDRRNYEVFVRKRPYVDEFIEEVGKYFEVIIFTASVPKYADPVINLLDTNHVIQHRLFRDSCTFSNGGFVKDLSKVGRTLNRTLIIDNSAPAFQFHPNHSILIESWFDDPNDTELMKLTPFLVELSKADDVRGLLREWKNGKRNW